MERFDSDLEQRVLEIHRKFNLEEGTFRKKCENCEHCFENDHFSPYMGCSKHKIFIFAMTLCPHYEYGQDFPPKKEGDFSRYQPQIEDLREKDRDIPEQLEKNEFIAYCRADDEMLENAYCNKLMDSYDAENVALAVWNRFSLEDCSIDFSKRMISETMVMFYEAGDQIVKNEDYWEGDSIKGVSDENSCLNIMKMGDYRKALETLAHKQLFISYSALVLILLHQVGKKMDQTNKEQFLYSAVVGVYALRDRLGEKIQNDLDCIIEKTPSSIRKQYPPLETLSL